MPVYMLHGFRWPRAGFTGIRVYIVLHNLEEAAAEYLQQPLTTELLLKSFERTQADLMPRLPELRFIEYYDPADESSNTVSQDYAYVGARVLTIPDGGEIPAGMGPGENIEDAVEQGSGLTQDQMAALEELRDRIAPGEKIGWHLVYNGDPERWYPPSEDEEDEFDDVSYGSEKGERTTEPGTPGSPQSVAIHSVEQGGEPRQYTRGSSADNDDLLQLPELDGCRPGDLCRDGSFVYPGPEPPGEDSTGKVDEEKVKLKGEVHRLVAPRDQKYQSNFVEFRRSTKIVYRRYAGLFFCVCVDANDNELAYLEAIHFFVEVLDQFFGNVCELDLVFNFYKVYAILDEVFLAGEIEETSKQVVLTRLEHLDKLE
ncbi:AP complex mu/sigma subunit [Penicillium riverlandense]|uniref:AP complex mu/sigma subunit n=1 Tax=Penicillium riverlandense TaxID=1903569 RepID=UPI002546B91C|nr:AP complex mu/sigma subunit [Penicillium riverlandense]KAJ5819535.1 AP complex mu/sigma subunit [Penicillium riverlandense]